MLRLAHYRGFVHIDYEGVEEPEAAVPRSVRYMRGLLHLLARQQLLRPPLATASRPTAWCARRSGTLRPRSRGARPR
jgi:hypothetical protein